MEFNKVVECRRSIRHYDAEKTVSREQIEEMLGAAIQAPSWKNSQTARYYVVMEPDLLETVRTTCLPAFNAVNVSGAPVLIVTSFVKSRSGFNTDGTPAGELGDGWGFYDLGIHNEHLVLKATDLGLDTLIMGIRDADKLRGLLGIPEEEILVAVISVGYRSQDAAMPKRKSVADIAKFFQGSDEIEKYIMLWRFQYVRDRSGRRPPSA